MEPIVIDIGMDNFEYRSTTIPRLAPSEESEDIELTVGNAERLVKVGRNLDPVLKDRIVKVLRENTDVFAFSADEMPSVDTEVMVHHLNVNPECKPVKQKKRNFSREKDDAIREEV